MPSVLHAASSNPHAGARTGQASRFEHEEASTGCMQQYRTKQGGKKLAESLSLGFGKQAKMNAIHGVSLQTSPRTIHSRPAPRIYALAALKSPRFSLRTPCSFKPAIFAMLGRLRAAKGLVANEL